MPSDTITARKSRERPAVYALFGAALLIGAVVVYAYLSRPPQMGASEEVFKTVDALYTAVRGQDEKRLGECEQRLHRYRDAGQLPSAAADSLDSIIGKARSGAWESAAERLYEFMLAQRREGADGHHEPKPKSPPTGRAKR